MPLRDFIDEKIVAMIDEKLRGRGIPFEQFVEEALLTKLAAPSHRTLKSETLIRIWDTAIEHGHKKQFKHRFFHFNFGLKIYSTDDPHPWDETHPYYGPNPPIEEDRKFLQEMIDLRKPHPEGPQRDKSLDFFLE